jgi:chromatin remodeling complex protein RSC6
MSHVSTSNPLHSIMSKGAGTGLFTKHLDTFDDVFKRRLIALDFVPVKSEPLKTQSSYSTISTESSVKLSPALLSLLGISSSSYLKHSIVILLLNGYIMNHNGYDAKKCINYDKNLWTVLQIPEDKEMTMQTIIPYLIKHYI